MKDILLRKALAQCHYNPSDRFAEWKRQGRYCPRSISVLVFFCFCGWSLWKWFLFLLSCPLWLVPFLHKVRPLSLRALSQATPSDSSRQVHSNQTCIEWISHPCNKISASPIYYAFNPSTYASHVQQSMAALGLKVKFSKNAFKEYGYLPPSLRTPPSRFHL